MSTVTPTVPLLPGSQMFAMRALIVVIFGVYCALALPAAGAGLFVLGATACRWLFYRFYRNAERAFDADLSEDEAAERRRDRFVRRYYWLGGWFWRAHRVRTMSPAEFDIRAQRHAFEIWIVGIGAATVSWLVLHQLSDPRWAEYFAVATAIGLVGFAATIWTWYWPVKAKAWSNL